MKKRLVLGVFCLLPVFAMGYESNLLNLVTPSSLEARYAEFALQHQFYTKVETLAETWFGEEPSGGANPGFGYRMNFGKGIELNAAYSVNNPSKGFSIGAGYVWTVPVVKQNVQINIVYFNTRVASDTREGNAFFLLAWQSLPIAGRIRAVCNLGYNHYNEKFGPAIGFSVQLTEKLKTVGEYYLATDPLDLELKNTMVFGFDYATYGHHFMLKVSNNVENGVRRLMRGSASNDFYLGFAIYRLLQF